MQRWLSVSAYGLFTRTLFSERGSPTRMRAAFERFGRYPREVASRRYPALTFKDHQVGSLELESLCAVPDPKCVILYLHGGAFLMGSPASYRRRTMKVSHRCRAELFVPNYRLAPEHPFPAALEDALAAYRYVRAQRPGVPLLVAGDSAGGGLCLSLMVAARDEGLERPDGAFLFSPWTDLSQSGDSVVNDQGRDRWLNRALLDAWAAHYQPIGDRRDALVSPVCANLSGLPRMLLFAGDQEVLFDDARRVVDRVRAAGGEARLHEGRGMQHDWPLTLPWLPESVAAWADVQRFVQRIVSAAGAGRSQTRVRTTGDGR